MFYKIILWLNLSLLLLHEMDAVRTGEWKMMYGFNRLPEDIASKIFIGLHFFLFITLYYMLEFHPVLLYWSLCIFGVSHQVLHIAFRKHPSNKMNSIFSGSIILFMAVVSISGILYGLLNYD